MAKRGRPRGGRAWAQARRVSAPSCRHASLSTRAGTLAGRTTPTPSTAAVMAVTKVGLDWLELWPSADAQQLSAWACVSTRSDPERCESPLCIGHSAPSAQHAMRASGVASHPAQTAAFPTRSPAVRRTADRRLIRIGTALRMLEPSRSVKRAVNQGLQGSQDSVDTISIQWTRFRRCLRSRAGLELLGAAEPHVSVLRALIRLDTVTTAVKG